MLAHQHLHASQDGISDSEENRRLWREFAYEAYDLLQEVHRARPDDPHVHVLMAEVRRRVCPDARP